MGGCRAGALDNNKQFSKHMTIKRKHVTIKRKHARPNKPHINAARFTTHTQPHNATQRTSNAMQRRNA